MDFAQLMPPGPASPTPSAAATTVAPSAAAQAAGKALSLTNPLTVWVGLGAVVFGLMAFSTSVRVGHTTAALSLGDTK